MTTSLFIKLNFVVSHYSILHLYTICTYSTAQWIITNMSLTHWGWTARGISDRRSLCGPPAGSAASSPAPDLSGPDWTESLQLGTGWTTARPEDRGYWLFLIKSFTFIRPWGEALQIKTPATLLYFWLCFKKRMGFILNISLCIIKDTVSSSIRVHGDWSSHIFWNTIFFN